MLTSNGIPRTVFRREWAMGVIMVVRRAGPTCYLLYHAFLIFVVEGM